MTRDVEPPKGIRKHMEKLYRLYIYSGLNRVFARMSFELYSILLLLSVAVQYFLVFCIAQNVFYTIWGAIVYVVLIVLVEKLMAFRNYKIVEDNLLNFLDMLGNFSAANVEIISVFRQISKYFPAPLSVAIEECVSEAETMGNTSAALYALADKIEQPQFKEVIYDLEVCVNYAGNYKEAINKWRRLITDMQLEKKQRTSMANELSITMIITSVGMVFCLAAVDKLITASIWDIVFHTTFGQACVVLLAGIYLFFWYKIVTIEGR